MSVIKNLKLTNHKTIKFKIIVPSYNSEKWIDKTLSSIASQNYKNYDVTIIDDCSTDSNQIKKEDFLDIDGKFMKCTYDVALMFPIAEMSGGKFKFIEEILYVYNNDNPINVNKVIIEEQFRICELIRNRNVYKTLY